MKKLLPFFLLLLPVIVHAQKFSGGIKAGVNFANQHFPGNNIADQGHNEAVIRFHLGMYGVCLLSERFSIQSEMLLSEGGTRFVFYNSYPPTPDSRTYLERIFLYANLPVMLRYNVSRILSLHAGPQIGLLVHRYWGAAWRTGPPPTYVPEYYYPQVQHYYDISLGAGLAFELPAGLSAGMRYNLGLIDVYIWPEDVTNHALQLYAGYRLFGKKL